MKTKTLNILCLAPELISGRIGFEPTSEGVGTPNPTVGCFLLRLLELKVPRFSVQYGNH